MNQNDQHNKISEQCIKIIEFASIGKVENNFSNALMREVSQKCKQLSLIKFLELTRSSREASKRGV